MAQSSGESVATEDHGAVAVMRFKPRDDGTISNKGADLLLRELDRLLADAGTRALVLTGAEPALFIRHANLGQIGRAGDALRAGLATEQDFLDTPFQSLCRLLDRAEKPVIAAINGDCMGGGLEIALACTARIAAPSIHAIGLPEIRLAIPPGSGGPQRLARLIGLHRARLFVLKGTVVSSEDAFAMGIVDELNDDPVAAAVELAGRFARRSPDAVAAIMRQMAPDDEAALKDNARAFAETLRSEDAAQMLEELLHSPRPIETLD